MKYLKQFKTIDEFNAYAQRSDKSLPNVSYIIDGSTPEKPIVKYINNK